MGKRKEAKTLLEVFTGGNYTLEPAPMVWVDAASTRKSQPVLSCPHCGWLHEWVPSSWICTHCNGRVIPPPPAGGSGDILTAAVERYCGRREFDACKLDFDVAVVNAMVEGGGQMCSEDEVREAILNYWEVEDPRTREAEIRAGQMDMFSRRNDAPTTT